MIPLRLLLAGGAVVALLGVGSGLYWKVRHDQHERDRAKIEAAQAQAKTDEVTAQAVDHYTEHTIVIREKAAQAVQRVQQAPNANQPVPPEVLGAWRAGIERLRDGDAKGGDPPSR